jgi:hypothetical protein
MRLEPAQHRLVGLPAMDWISKPVNTAIYDDEIVHDARLLHLCGQFLAVADGDQLVGITMDE